MIGTHPRRQTTVPKWRTRAVWLLALLAADATFGAPASDWVSNGPFGGSVQHLGASPSDPSRLVAATRRGLFGTTDGGATWRIVAALGDRRVDAIAVSHGIPPHFFVLASNNSVLKSLDGDATWKSANSGLPPAFLEDLVIAPSAPAILYLAGTSDIAGVVFRSTDHGTTWQETAPQLPNGISLLAVDPVDSSVVYAGEFAPGNLHKTTDSGQAWRPLAPTGLSILLTLAVDPTNASTLFAGGLDGVSKSIDGGDSWAPAGKLSGLVAALVFVPGQPSALYAATAGGVFRSADDGATWQPFDQGLTTQETLSLAVADEEIFVGSGHGVFARKVSAALWQERNEGLHGTSISALVLDPQRPSTVYGAGENGVYRSVDAGRSWQRTPLDPRSGVTALAIDPVDPRILYAGTFFDAVFKSADGGASWTSVGNGLPSSLVGGLAVDPSDPMIVYSGHQPVHNGTSPPGLAIRGVYKSLDGGISWTHSSSGMTGSMAIAALAFDPSDPATLYTADRFG